MIAGLVYLLLSSMKSCRTACSDHFPLKSGILSDPTALGCVSGDAGHEVILRRSELLDRNSLGRERGVWGAGECSILPVSPGLERLHPALPSPNHELLHAQRCWMITSIMFEGFCGFPCPCCLSSVEWNAQPEPLLWSGLGLVWFIFSCSGRLAQRCLAEGPWLAKVIQTLFEKGWNSAGCFPKQGKKANRLRCGGSEHALKRLLNERWEHRLKISLRLWMRSSCVFSVVAVTTWYTGLRVGH